MRKIQPVFLLERIFNVIDLTGIVVILSLAFLFQVLLKELPCPLCLLQRVGFLGIAFGFLLNLRFGLRPSHYSVVLISAFFTSFVALRQIALHVVPGTGSYGSSLFGFHFYTWSFIAAMTIGVVTSIMLAFDQQYAKPGKPDIRWRYLTYFLFLVVLGLIIANVASVFLECGLFECPENPINYQF